MPNPSTEGQLPTQLPARFALVNGRIALPNAIVTGQALLVADGRIAAISPTGSLANDGPQIDVGGRLIAPA